MVGVDCEVESDDKHIKGKPSRKRRHQIHLLGFHEISLCFLSTAVALSFVILVFSEFLSESFVTLSVCITCRECFEGFYTLYEELERLYQVYLRSVELIRVCDPLVVKDQLNLRGFLG